MLWTRRRVGRALGLALAAPALTACRPLPGPPPVRFTGGGYQLRPVDEALWVCGEDAVLWALDGRTDTVTARLPLPIAPPKYSAPFLYAGPVLWAYEFRTGVVVAVDPAEPRVLGRTTLPAAENLAGIASWAAYDALWVTGNGRLFRIDAAGRMTSTALPTGFVPSVGAATAKWLWIAGRERLLRIDPAHPDAILVVDLPPDSPVESLVAGPDALYAVAGTGKRLLVLDSETGTVLSTLDLDDLASGVFPVGGDLWVAGDTTVRRVRDGRAEAPFTPVADPDFMESSAMFDGAVWGVVIDEIAVVRADLASRRADAMIPVEAAEPEDAEYSVYAGEKALWVLDGDFYNGISRIDPVSRTARKIVPMTGVENRYCVAGRPPKNPATS